MIDAHLLERRGRAVALGTELGTPIAKQALCGGIEQGGRDARYSAKDALFLERRQAADKQLEEKKLSQYPCLTDKTTS